MALDGHHRIIIADSSQSSYVKLFGMITLRRRRKEKKLLDFGTVWRSSCNGLQQLNHGGGQVLVMMRTAAVQRRIVNGPSSCYFNMCGQKCLQKKAFDSKQKWHKKWEACWSYHHVRTYNVPNQQLASFTTLPSLLTFRRLCCLWLRLAMKTLPQKWVHFTYLTVTDPNYPWRWVP